MGYCGVLFGKVRGLYQKKMIKVCEKCKRESLIHAKGLCGSCYSYKVSKSNPNTKSNKKRWQQNNLKYFRDYMRKRLGIPKEKWRELDVITKEQGVENE